MPSFVERLRVVCAECGRARWRWRHCICALQQCTALSGFRGWWGYQCDLSSGHGGKHVCEVAKWSNGDRETISWEQS